MDYRRINIEEIKGMTFGRLTVVESYKNDKGRVRVKARCFCNGNVSDYDYYSLRTGHTLSCGCLRKEIVSNEKSIHHGKGTRLYNIWKGMRQRCNNKNHPEYNYYGGNGIKICNEWDDFSKFKDWALNHGYSDTLTIERKDLNEGYNPNNCCWITKGMQSSNKRDTVLMTINGVTKPFCVWCKEYNVNYKTIKRRMEKGLSFYEALSVPKGKHIT